MKKLPIFLCLMLLIAGAIVAAPRAKRSQGPAPEDVAKADYLYLEALRARSQDNHDAAFELLERAHNLNPDDKATGFELARYLLAIPSDDTLRQALSLMRGYHEANPSDYQWGARYGMVLMQLKRTDEAIKVWETLHNYYPERTQVTTILADALASTDRKENTDRAIALYDSLEIAEGPSIQLSSSKIQILYSRADTAAMLREADRLRDSRPDNSEFAIFSGDVYGLFGSHDKALGFYDKAIELDPANGHAYYAKAQFYLNTNDSTAYDREVVQALQQTNLDVATKMTILSTFIQDTKTDSLKQPRIFQLFDTLALQHPLEHDIHRMYAAYLVETGDYPQALEQQEQALGLDPADKDGWDLLSSLYLQTEDYDGAIDAINRSLHYYPDDPSQHFKLGSIYSFKNEPERSNPELEKALALTDSTNLQAISAIYTSIADNYFKLGQPDSAFILYDRALLYNPDNTLALNNAAYFMACEDRNLDKALEMSRRAVEQDASATNLDTYAWVLFKRKEYAEAREAIDRALELTEEPETEILQHAGDIYFMEREPARALDFWRQALKLDPDNDLLKRKVKNKTFYYE